MSQKKYLGLDGLAYTVGRLREDAGWHDMQYSDTTFYTIITLKAKKIANFLMIKVSGTSTLSEASITVSGRIKADGFSQCFLATGGVWAAAFRSATDGDDNPVTVISFARILDVEAGKVANAAFTDILGEEAAAADGSKGGIISPPISIVNVINVCLIIPTYVENVGVLPITGIGAEEGE